MDGVNAIRQVFCFRIAVLIAYQRVTLALFRIVIAAGTLQIHLKFCALLRRFNLCASVIGVLDDGNAPFDDLLRHVIGRGVQLNGVILRLRPYMVYGFIQKITLGWRNLPDAPVIAADIILCSEFPLAVGGVGVDQGVPVINAIHCTRQRCVTLRLPGFLICFCYVDTELL